MTVKKKELHLYAIKDISELAAGYAGIPEPSVMRGRKINLADIDIAIIPGAGFDVKGNRIGYGAGYYDKLLSGTRAQVAGVSKKELTPDPQSPLPILIALAFEEQIVPSIPDERHDVKMDKIITEKRVIDCRNR